MTSVAFGARGFSRVPMVQVGQASVVEVRAASALWTMARQGADQAHPPAKTTWWRHGLPRPTPPAKDAAVAAASYERRLAALGFTRAQLAPLRASPERWRLGRVLFHAVVPLRVLGFVDNADAVRVAVVGGAGGLNALVVWGPALRENGLPAAQLIHLAAGPGAAKVLAEAAAAARALLLAGLGTDAVRALAAFSVDLLRRAPGDVAVLRHWGLSLAHVRDTLLSPHASPTQLSRLALALSVLCPAGPAADAVWQAIITATGAAAVGALAQLTPALVEANYGPDEMRRLLAAGDRALQLLATYGNSMRHQGFKPREVVDAVVACAQRVAADAAPSGTAA